MAEIRPQVIDVRDLAAWILLAAERGITGAARTPTPAGPGPEGRAVTGNRGRVLAALRQTT